MEYVQTVKEALVVAMENNCFVWTDFEGTIFDVEAMLSLLKAVETKTLPKDHYFAVSIEGAIGIANGYEFDIDWLFYPVLDEKVRQKYIEAFNRRIKESAPGAQLQRQTNNFCSYCGNQLLPGAKFCSSCGAKA